MPRGGKRDKAGRKTTWKSNVKFEETSPIRVPNYIKNKILEIAHRLDAGEEFDFVSNSNQKQAQDFEARLVSANLENQKLLEQVKTYHSDLETKTKELEVKLQELQQENHRLQGLVIKDKSSDSTDLISFTDSIIEFAEKWRKKINGLTPIDIAAKTSKILTDLQKIASDRKLNFDIVNNSQIELPPPKLETVTKSKNEDIEIVSKSVKHTQLGLLNIGTNSNSQPLEPLTSSQLSKRFNKKPEFVKVKKYQLKNKIDKFLLLLKQSDPQGIGWQYSEEDKKYHPIVEFKD